jgi:hypothetical protein
MPLLSMAAHYQTLSQEESLNMAQKVTQNKYT